MEIVGMDVHDSVLSGEECTYFAGDAAIEEAACHVVHGGITLYLGAHDWGTGRTRTLSASTADPEEDFEEEITAEALDVIREAMNAGEDASPFLERSADDDYAVAGLVGVRYITGSTHGGAEVAGESGGGAGTVGAATVGADAVKSSHMDTVGISLLAVGLTALVALALALAVARRRPRDDSYSAFHDDKDLEDSDKRTDVDDDDDLSSTPSAPDAEAPATPLSTAKSSTAGRQRRGGRKAAYVVGEEASLDTTRDTRHAADVSCERVEAGNGNSDNQRMDVHHCTSATCPICHGRATTFVSAFDDGDEAATEGYEFGYQPYAPREAARNPAFDNPALIARPYVVDDTVQF